MIIKVSLNKR